MADEQPTGGRLPTPKWAVAASYLLIALLFLAIPGSFVVLGLMLQRGTPEHLGNAIGSGYLLLLLSLILTLCITLLVRRPEQLRHWRLSVFVIAICLLCLLFLAIFYDNLALLLVSPWLPTFEQIAPGYVASFDAFWYSYNPFIAGVTVVWSISVTIRGILRQQHDPRNHVRQMPLR